MLRIRVQQLVEQLKEVELLAAVRSLSAALSQNSC
jgi:hypothetical protein